MPHLSDILFHLGENRERYFNAVSPPVIQSSNFVFDSLDDCRAAFADEHVNHLYTRGNNPTVQILRKKIAALEGAEDALVFSSGSAAIAAAVMSQVRAGDHIVCVESPYSWTRILVRDLLGRFGVSHTFVDGRSVADLEAACRDDTALLILESPTSLTFELQDLRAVADFAKRRGIITCIDNSCASPHFQNPLALGIDLVMHSATKYINGHSDVVVGVVAGSEAHMRRIFSDTLMTLGGILSPHDAALVLRGLRTFELRMERCDATGRRIAEFLHQHPKIASVNYGLLPEHPQYELARRQMRGWGGLFSFTLATDDFATCEAFFNRLNRFLLAVSWGGHESLILPSVVFYNIANKEDTPLPPNFVRLYVGLEDADWLIEDLAQALKVLPG